MLKELLQKIGLTRGETEVYIAVTKIGNTSTGEIIRRAKISRSKVYELLEKLKQKGLVTEMIKNNIKYFEATTPKKISEYMMKKRKELEKIEEESRKLIPLLETLKQKNKESQETQIYVGLEGWKTLYLEIVERLPVGGEYLAFGIESEGIQEEQLVTFFKNFHQKRNEKKIKAKIIVRPEKETLMKKEFSKEKEYEYKIIDETYPIGIAIFNDSVAHLVWDEHPVAFVITSKKVAKRYKDYFNTLWNSNSKRIKKEKIPSKNKKRIKK